MINCVDIEKVEKKKIKKGLEDKEWVEKNKSDEKFYQNKKKKQMKSTYPRHVSQSTYPVGDNSKNTSVHTVFYTFTHS